MQEGLTSKMASTGRLAVQAATNRAVVRADKQQLPQQERRELLSTTWTRAPKHTTCRSAPEIAIQLTIHLNSTRTGFSTQSNSATLCYLYSERAPEHSGKTQFEYCRKAASFYETFNSFVWRKEFKLLARRHTLLFNYLNYPQNGLYQFGIDK